MKIIRVKQKEWLNPRENEADVATPIKKFDSGLMLTLVNIFILVGSYFFIFKLHLNNRQVDQ